MTEKKGQKKQNKTKSACKAKCYKNDNFFSIVDKSLGHHSPRQSQMTYIGKILSKNEFVFCHYKNVLLSKGLDDDCSTFRREFFRLLDGVR